MVPADEQFEVMGSGQWHICALRADGSPVCWGSDQNGEVSLTPQDETLIAVSGGRWNTCGLRKDGNPVCWGVSTRGLPRGEHFVALSNGEKHTCALRADGTPVCWGDNASGQTDAPEGERFVAIDSGWGHTCGLRPDGIVVCWGWSAAVPQGLTVALPEELPLLTDIDPAGPPERRESEIPDLSELVNTGIPHGQCHLYDPSVSWLEDAVLPDVSICYTTKHEGSATALDFVKRWVVHGKGLMQAKYRVPVLQNPNTGADLRLSILLLPEPDGNADYGTTRHMCCYDSSGELNSGGTFAWIPYVTPAHTHWNTRPSWGRLGLPTADFHSKNIIHELTHAGQHTAGALGGRVPSWVYEGLAEYEGSFNGNEYGKDAVLDLLRRYVLTYLPDRIFLATPLDGGPPSIRTDDEYFASNLIMTYLAERFGEDIHRRIIWHTYDTFEKAMKGEFEAQGTTVTEVFNDLKAWVR